MFDPLLPPSQTPLEAALGRSMPPAGLQPEIIATLWHPASCPAPLLPWLAWALSVDEWDAEWSEAQQRAVCAASFAVHRQKGTVGAVRRAMDAIGYRTRLIEAWQQTPPGAPHTFTAEIEIDDRGIEPQLINQLQRQIAAVKPERSHFDLCIVGSSAAPISIACITLSGEIVTVEPYQITEAEAPVLAPTHAAGWQAFGSVTLYPLQ